MGSVKSFSGAVTWQTLAPTTPLEFQKVLAVATDSELRYLDMTTTKTNKIHRATKLSKSEDIDNRNINNLHTKKEFERVPEHFGK